MLELLKAAAPLPGTAGQEYVERRGIPVKVAIEAGVRYADDWGGRPAVVIGLYDQHGVLRSVHGRHFHVVRGQDKMHTIGPGGGAISVLGGWRVDPLIIVEGLFDALSLAVCGYACIATIGRSVPWLPEIAAGRAAWIAFDNCRSGDESAAQLNATLPGARRLHPPGRLLDWNTALLKRGRGAVGNHLAAVVRDEPSILDSES